VKPCKNGFGWIKQNYIPLLKSAFANIGVKRNVIVERGNLLYVICSAIIKLSIIFRFIDVRLFSEND